MRTHGLLPVRSGFRTAGRRLLIKTQMGQARLLPSSRIARSQSRHRRQAGLQPHRARSRAHDSVRSSFVSSRAHLWLSVPGAQIRCRAATDPRAVLSFRRRCDLLSLHEIRPPIRLLALQHYPPQPRRSPSKRHRNALRDPSHGSSLLFSRQLPS